MIVIKYIVEVNFFFAVLGLPLFYIVTTYTGEIKLLTDIMEIKDEAVKIQHLLYIIISGVSGIVITLSLLMVCTICSPIAINITGKIDKG